MLPPKQTPENSRAEDPTADQAKAAPRYKALVRNQSEWRQFAVEDLIDAAHPARMIWEFLGTLDLSPFERDIKAVEGHAGQSAFEPRLLIGLWIYACTEAVSSARELARLCAFHPAYRWLCADEPVNYHTLADFRVGHREALESLLGEVVGVLLHAGLVDLKRVMQDGTRIEAAASSKSFHRRHRLEQCVEAAAEQVRALSERGEEESGRRVEAARRRAAEEQHARLEQARQELERIQRGRRGAAEREQSRVSVSDPECRIMRHADRGFKASYNVQLSTDAAHSIIVGVETTAQGSDFAQLIPALEKIEKRYGRGPEQTVVDGGFVSRENIIASEAHTELIGNFQMIEHSSAQRREKYGIAVEYARERFVYDAPADRFQCPAGKPLRRIRVRERGHSRELQYRAEVADCGACAAKWQCSPHTASRNLIRIEEHSAVQRFQARMETVEARAIYRQRAQIAEFPNCWIKQKFGLRRFHVRGLVKVQMEALWHVIAYNLRQWIRLRAKLVPATV